MDRFVKSIEVDDHMHYLLQKEYTEESFFNYINKSLETHEPYPIVFRTERDCSLIINLNNIRKLKVIYEV